MLPRPRRGQRYHLSQVKSVSAIIVARGLVKRYGNFTAVDGISFEVEEGEALGLLGPNGAGKTTTIRLICGLSPLTAGELLVDGLDVRRHARPGKWRVGIGPQPGHLDPELPVRQNLPAPSRPYDPPPSPIHIPEPPRPY